MTTWLLRARPVWLLLAVALAIGVAHTLTMLPPAMALGEGAFWTFPRGTVNGGDNDFAQALDGYLHFRGDSWHWPLLLVPQVMPSAGGTNLFWLDAVPWVSLLGKLAYRVVGIDAILLGPFQFACFAVTGAAMTLALVAFGERSLLATLAGATLAVALPFHYAEWGHLALCAQFVIPLALGLYGWGLRRPPVRYLPALWFALLAMTLLTQIYLFGIVGVLWVAALVQRVRDVSAWRVGAEAAATIGGTVVIMIVTGMLSSDLRSAGAGGFGEFSLNLGSPFVPQNSGMIAPLGHYMIGTRNQVFGYLGLGVLLILIVGVATSAAWWWRARRPYGPLAVVLVGCFLFALSYRVTLGSTVLVSLPLSEQAVHALGVFRASGRFFWPVGYALLLLAVLTVVRRLSPGAAAIVLAAACVLQLVDVSPVRSAIARTAAVAAPAQIDRAGAAALADGARGMMLFPSFGCVPVPDPSDPATIERARMLRGMAMEFQLIAARRGLTINSVYNPRLPTDCAAEAAARARAWEPGILYVYLDGAAPRAGGAECRTDGGVQLCRIADATGTGG